MIPPPIRPGDIPLLHRLDEYVFQGLCRELFSNEDEVATCDDYGVRGQAQYGIDLKAYRKHGDAIEVGQCKCYEDFPPRLIVDASDKFFNHWDRWSSENVKRFILFVACDLSNRWRQEEISRQKKRFKKVGVVYEAWGSATILGKMRPYPGIVKSYLVSDDWVKTICGGVSPLNTVDIQSRGMTSIIVDAVMFEHVERLASIVSEDVELRIDSFRTAWREGRKTEVVDGIRDLKSDSTRWNALSPEVRAKALCFEARLELDINGSVNQAKKLADEARALVPSDSQARLRALIAYKEDGPEAAVQFLEEEEDVDSLNLRAALLLEMGYVDECRAILNFEGQA